MSTSTLYTLEHASVRGPLGPAVAPLDLTIADRRVTALVGPVGSGKSTLLRLLSGRPPSEGWSVDGRWIYRGRALDASPSERRPLEAVAWVPQIRHAPVGAFDDPRESAAVQTRLDSAFFCGSSVVLLDEPTRGLSADDREALIPRIREHAREGAVVVISHDLGFVRRVADEVCLLSDGELIAQRPASEFFDQPEQDLVQQFIVRGTCALPPLEPTLPSHFHWFTKERLAGMGRPGLLRDLDDDLFSIAYAGITQLVSLTDQPVPTRRLRPFGIAGRHFPIRDMGTPSLSETMTLCRDLMRAVERGQVIAVHCHAGLGRTGTILACLGVSTGMSSASAIAEVRRQTPGSIQTEGQATFVRQFELQC